MIEFSNIYKEMLDRSFEIRTASNYTKELQEKIKQYCTNHSHMIKAHDINIKKKVERLVDIGKLRNINNPQK